MDPRPLVATLMQFLEARASSDPETRQTIGLLQQAIALELEPGGALDPDSPSNFRLSSLRRPLEAYLFARENPTTAAGIPIVAAAGLVGLGYLFGKRSR